MNWINVKDKRPEQDGRYLVYEKNYNWVGVSALREGKFDCSATTHWMPLPEKPE